MNSMDKRKTAASYWLQNRWPLTITADRYGGAYSKGRFTAWPKDPDSIPWQIDGGDTECDEFWHGEGSIEILCGKGSTPGEAYEDLVRKQQEYDDEIT